MKKIGCLLACALLALTLAGCLRADLIELVFHGEGYGLKRDDAIAVANIFDQSDWTDPLKECPADYSLLTDRGPMEYCASQGIFNNTEIERSYQVSEQDRLVLNEMFARYAAENG